MKHKLIPKSEHIDHADAYSSFNIPLKDLVKKSAKLKRAGYTLNARLEVEIEGSYDERGIQGLAVVADRLETDEEFKVREAAAKIKSDKLKAAAVARKLKQKTPLEKAEMAAQAVLKKAGINGGMVQIVIGGKK